MVYVSQHDNHHVSVFTSEGQFVMTFGRRGEGPGEFICPCGLAVDNSGVVYVCGMGNNCVQVF
jgi:tripartite motif-containing protein 2/3/tripartite motif-containing protein 71